MQRRDLLRLVGGLSVISGLSPEQLWALGRATHEESGGSLGFFDTHQLHTVAAAGERIIPATDTPGAMAAECHRFTERIVAHHYDANRQARFIDGLVDLDRRSSIANRELFVELESEQQDGVLSAVEDDAYRGGSSGADTFWRDLKQLTLYGYYTSEIGIRQELKTPIVPGRFEGAMLIENAN